MTSRPAPPIARRDPRRFEQLGRVRVDEYAWLKDEDWQAVMREPGLLHAEIREHLERENAYTAAMMAPTAALQEAIYQEMRGRVKEDDSTVPSPDGPWDYYRRFNMGAQHPIYARRPRGLEGPEHILLDVEAQAQGHKFYKVASAQHAPGHALFAYAVDQRGSEIFQVRVRDLASGQDLDSVIDNCTGDFCWSPDGRYIFWTYRDENGRPAKVYRRPARGGEDTLVYDEPDDGFFLGVHVTESQEFIVIHAGHHAASETHIIPAAAPESAPLVFHRREEDVLYRVTHWDGRWFVLTNADGAVDFKVMVCAPDQTGRA
ncbi:MAG: S9 family peptidase, partial [Hyphomonadaceae bacterium]|nr:S9 family peptidase [Hyphomonadaceae bacterium]